MGGILLYLISSDNRYTIITLRYIKTRFYIKSCI